MDLHTGCHICPLNCWEWLFLPIVSQIIQMIEKILPLVDFFSVFSWTAGGAHEKFEWANKLGDHYGASLSLSSQLFWSSRADKHLARPIK